MNHSDPCSRLQLAERSISHLEAKFDRMETKIDAIGEVASEIKAKLDNMPEDRSSSLQLAVAKLETKMGVVTWFGATLGTIALTSLGGTLWLILQRGPSVP